MEDIRIGSRIEYRTEPGTEIRHETKVTSQMIQYMKVLQLNAAKFDAYIKSAAEENPMIEILMTDPVYDDGYMGRVGGSDNRIYTEPADTAELFTDTLEFELLSQIPGDVPETERKIINVVIESLDAYGYFTNESRDFLVSAGIPEGLLDGSVAILQKMDPAGVGASDDEDCARLQRERGVPVRIRPGEYYGTGGGADPVIPDIYIYKTERIQTDDGGSVHEKPYIGAFAVAIDKRHEPALTLSAQYMSLLKTAVDKETKEYLKEKRAQAEWMINCVEQRYKTLLSLSEAIAELQADFLCGRSPGVKPLTLKDLADKAEIHPSTVSRAIRDKYVSTDMGTFPIGFFVPRARSTAFDTMTYADIIRRRIRNEIYDESKDRPLSDQMIADKLVKDGYRITRRTVAKYRQEMYIPDSRARRRRTVL